MTNAEQWLEEKTKDSTVKNIVNFNELVKNPDSFKHSVELLIYELTKVVLLTEKYKRKIEQDAPNSKR